MSRGQKRLSGRAPVMGVDAFRAARVLLGPTPGLSGDVADTAMRGRGLSRASRGVSARDGAAFSVRNGAYSESFGGEITDILATLSSGVPCRACWGPRGFF